MTTRTGRLLLLALLAAFAAASVDPRLVPAGMAWADDDEGGDDDGNDDDDGGDDDDADDDGGGGGTGGGRSSSADDGGGDDDDRPRLLRRVFPRQEPPPVIRRAARPAAPVPPPPTRREEIVAMDLSAADLGVLVSEGFTVLEEQVLPAFGVTLRRLQAPRAMTLEAARDRIRRLDTGREADFNHFYRGEAGDCTGPHCASVAQIGWALPSTREGCGADILIGMIDTGLNADHDTFEGARLEIHRMGPDAAPSGEMHGTSVASLLVGAPGGRSPGLVPDARLLAVDAFEKVRGDERADAFVLIRALAHLIERDVAVINLSLAGPANDVLEGAVTRLVAEGVVIVAAAGNGGARAKPAYPAAYDGVLAVTAVDGKGEPYRRAGRGPHLDLAAPGVEVWTAASISGGRPKTGTSFAAPFVTAAAARLLQADTDATPVDIARRLADRAKDMGAPGHDEVFGHGLVPAVTCLADGPVPKAE
ncbi:S8 family serine peptidase [Falsirhodobacter sp. 20TX0035]|uniref:S8 family serine peptidase n=1 Tax=Falsirhodobacter sp. 20TX0035 TaxID=3022019 RepID=UPI00232E4BDA|nr:S8 family serine peptidase [Falsirhodobacter sp. 20TX0035]MDB6452597.1 S8 family serine peptidase [Falsirhodobacter sp. 20TX0035]